MKNITRKHQSRLLLATAAAFFLLTGCDKDREPAQPGGNTTQLAGINGGEHNLQFQYHTPGKPASIQTNMGSPTVETYTITYNNAGQVKELATADGTRISAVYDNGLLIRAHHSKTNNYLGYTNFHINDNRLLKMTFYKKMGEESVPQTDCTFTYTNEGNVKQMVVMKAGTTPNQLQHYGHVNYSYDNRLNPLLLQRELMWLLGYIVSNNNIVKEEHFNSGLAMHNLYEYTYSYGSNNLPAIALVRIGLPPDNAIEKTINYTYY